MHLERCVAIVGRPNVGKSRIFNRLARRRIAIVHDRPGVTRDIISATINDDYTLMDTGGLGMGEDLNPQKIVDATEDQVDFAIQAASLVLFVVDGPEGLMPQDEAVAERLRKAGKKVILLVNKIDGYAQEHYVSSFYKLGFGTPIGISAEHNYNIEALEAGIAQSLGPRPEAQEDPSELPIRISLVGRPNVGKSSLSNALLRSERLIVSDIPGTTRDSVETGLMYTDEEGNKQPFTLVDTAGLRKKGKFDCSLEYLAGARTEAAIESSDIALLLVDATAGFTQQDKKIAATVSRAGKPVILIINKWDLAKKTFKENPLYGYDSPKGMRHGFVQRARKDFFFAKDAPVIFVSAKTKYKVSDILKEAIKLWERMNQKLSTGTLNQLLGRMMDKHRPTVVSGKRFKIYYATQVSNRPFKLRVFCNHKTRLEPSYISYLEGGLRSEFDLAGCPVLFEWVGKPKRDASTRLREKKQRGKQHGNVEALDEENPLFE